MKRRGKTKLGSGRAEERQGRGSRREEVEFDVRKGRIEVCMGRGRVDWMGGGPRVRKDLDGKREIEGKVGEEKRKDGGGVYEGKKWR